MEKKYSNKEFAKAVGKKSVYVIQRKNRKESLDKHPEILVSINKEEPLEFHYKELFEHIHQEFFIKQTDKKDRDDENHIDRKHSENTQKAFYQNADMILYINALNIFPYAFPLGDTEGPLTKKSNRIYYFSKGRREEERIGLVHNIKEELSKH